MIDETERKRKLKIRLIIIFIILGLVIAGNFTKIQGAYIKYIVHNTKNEQVVTKTLTTNEIFELQSNQLKLTYSYNKNERGWWKTDWLWKEIVDGLDSMYENYSIMTEHPEYDLVKIKFTIIKYKVDGKTVEFISKSKIIQVHSKDGWIEK
ncbi:hypothetical protein [Gottfriedia solisilvae]|uniref:Uncharacterized protein n=1 Tax=Gottfriedia solisilvae TaxID=1516104 RepID=A0A8J3AM63_9BACI|nr:hypothetical protein [Gottfriedia solisilvae]GGI12903.1 hypothetical protein GCM10007380_15240 [Gottfriedia solisilvae]